MKFKVIALILALVMAFSCVIVSAEENTGKVEISFKVGDSILKINGVDTQVETPFIAGEGTTLVPLRVITEAFGAQVEWVAETRSIILTYREVKVVLQIDNDKAQVNDHTETLAVAPMLVNNTTMVPLRFISETFGAQVGWNEEDKSISVVKETIEVGDTVQGGIAEKYVGDSYYGWLITTPQNYNLVTRTFDGSNTVFMNKSNNAMLYVNVIPNIKGDTLERLQMDADELFKDGVLTYATYAHDKDNNRYTYSYGTVKGQYQYIAQYVKDAVIYRVIMLSDSNGTEKEYLKSIVDSFSINYNSNLGVYDLSNVSENNTRIFTHELYRTSFEVPAHFLTVQTDFKNEIFLASGKKEDTSQIKLNIYSKSMLSLDKYVQDEHASDKSGLNRKITGVGPVVEYDMGNGSIKAKGYDIKIKGSTNYDGLWSKRFFEAGEYVYCLSIREHTKGAEGLINMILSTYSCEEIIKEDAGLLLKVDNLLTEPKEHNGTGFIITAPSNWSRTEYEDEATVALEEHITDSEAIFHYQYLVEDGIPMNYIYDALRDFASDQANTLQAEVVEEFSSARRDGREYYSFTLMVDMNDTPVYVTYAMVYHKGFLYRGTLFQYELNAFGTAYEEFLDIVLSMK